jgi:hypothetical protein
VGYDSFANAEVAEAGDDSFKTVTITDYLTAQGVAKLDLIVLDIEGAELGALQGADSFLAQPKGQAPNILFEVHRHYVDWSNGLADTRSPSCSPAMATASTGCATSTRTRPGRQAVE